MMHDDLLLLSMRSNGWAGDAALRRTRLSADLELLVPISSDPGGDAEESEVDAKSFDESDLLDYAI